MRVSILSNPDRDIQHVTARRIAEILSSKGVTVGAGAETAAALPAGTLSLDEEAFFRNADILIVIGGDGTILSAAERSISHALPMLCVNKGHLGFLSQAEEKEIPQMLDALVAGEYTIEKRMALTGEVLDEESRVLCSNTALNEFFVRSASAGRPINLKVQINQDSTGFYDADGIIIASPTGSTGYSLSAGGPVVTPDLDCFLLTPICAHNLQAKPIVISPESQVLVEMRQPTKLMTCFADGRHVMDVRAGWRVRIHRCPQNALFVRFRQRDFYSLLKQKLYE